ncbi:GNAT family N-acetyltransferase [Candidatus Berkiella aquae]|uniref:Acetyltransferase (GNAT) family protein n=1 Tax=Candidatus Berkiella aquae TaxID=295108 RepID=A0A0Q9YXB1_9GAMM|nr:GNAT family N-acetyltransferase [Candidatus Berkiella aquae]MCS5711496.1 GNAT family N-acetyltransferase [Candidatus Berkiella aquae]
MIEQSQSGFFCRTAKPDDVKFVYECLRESAEDAGLINHFACNVESLKNALFSEHPYAECIIAQINQEPIGLIIFSKIYNHFTLFTNPGIYVHDIFVVSNYRLNGVARRLANYLISFATEHQYSRIEGSIPIDEKAEKFFEFTFGKKLKKIDNANYVRLMLPKKEN